MKMIIAILKDEDRENVSLALIKAEFRVTRIASTGGFFRRGSTTLMVGVMEDKLEEALQTIRKHCTPSTDEGSKSATLFVISVSYFEQI